MQTIPTLVLVCLALAGISFFLLKQLQRRSAERDQAKQKAAEAAIQHQVMVEEISRHREADRFAAEEQAQLVATQHQQQLHQAQQAVDELLLRFKPITDVEEERQRVLDQVQELEEQHLKHQDTQRTFEQAITILKTEFKALDEEANLQSFGHYTPRYDFVTSVEYQQKLEAIRRGQKELITLGLAAKCATSWEVNGSVSEGRKKTNQYLKLMLRGFNGESDAAIAKVKYNNVTVMEARITKAFDAINKLATAQDASLSASYLNLKLEELYLVHEFQEKVQEEREVQRQIREQMREEELAQRELDKARSDAEKEERRYAEALRKAQQEVEQATGEKQQKLLAQIQALQEQLTQAAQLKQKAISQAQLTRSGHVYVISNIGSFGENVYKIGMTRRLDPLDRVKELGDASVPFHFDVHAVIYCDDAPKLENTLHKTFHKRRINCVNERKEFFNVSLLEIAEAVLANHGAIEFLHEAEAVEYRKSRAILQERAAEQVLPVLASN